MLVDENPLPKWKIALAVGGAAALTAGVYYTFFKKTNKNGTLPDVKEAEDECSPEKDLMEQMRSHNSQGSKLFRENKFEESVQEYTKAIELCLDQDVNKAELPTIYQNRAAAYERLRRFEDVINDCSEAVKLNPRYIKALVRKARVAEILGNLALALEDLTAACILEKFNNDKTMIDVDRVLKELGRSRAIERFGKEPISIPSKYIMKSFIRGYCSDEVINDIQEDRLDLEEDGGYLSAIKKMKECEYEDVIQLCSAELEKGVSSKYLVKSRLLRAIMYILTLDKENAESDLKAIYDDPEVSIELKATALVKHAVLYVAFNNVYDAKVLFERAMRLTPENADVHYQCGQMEVVLENINQALEKFTKACEICPDFPIGLIQKYHCEYRIADALSKGGSNKTFDRDAAMKKFEQIEKDFPDTPEARLIRIQLLLEAENFDEVEKVLNEMDLENSPHALVYRGMLMLQSKRDVRPAMEFLQKALQLDPECEMALENLATINVQLGKLDEGSKLLERVIPLSKCVNEMAHYYSLKEAAVAQINVFKRLGIAFNSLPTIPM